MHIPQTPRLNDQAYQRILLATDFSPASQAAFRESLNLCAVSKSALLILHVQQQDSPNIFPQSALSLEPLHQTASSMLSEWQQVARKAEVECQVSLKVGSPSQTILQTIPAEDIDLLILGTNALHGFERLVFGSTAELVLREAPCPVLTAGPQARPFSGNAGPVVFATDFHQTTTQALRHAASLSEALQVPLHCIHVLPRAFADKSADQCIMGIMTAALQQLTRELLDTASAPACKILYESEISRAIVQYAQTHGARLVVLGLRQASLLASSVPANIAYRVITEAPCPTVTAAFAKDTQTCIGASLRPSAFVRDPAASPCDRRHRHPVRADRR